MKKNFSVRYEEFFGLYFALDRFCHFIRRAKTGPSVNWHLKPNSIVSVKKYSSTSLEQPRPNFVFWHFARSLSWQTFLSRLQTEPSVSFQMNFTDRIPIHEVKIATEAKLLDVSLSKLSEESQFSDDLLDVVDKNFMNQLTARGLYDHLLTKKPTNEPNNPNMGFFSFTQVSGINLIETNDFEGVFNDLLNRSQTFDLKQEYRTV